MRLRRRDTVLAFWGTSSKAQWPNRSSWAPCGRVHRRTVRELGSLGSAPALGEWAESFELGWMWPCTSAHLSRAGLAGLELGSVSLNLQGKCNASLQGGGAVLASWRTSSKAANGYFFRAGLEVSVYFGTVLASWCTSSEAANC